MKQLYNFKGDDTPSNAFSFHFIPLGDFLFQTNARLVQLIMSGTFVPQGPSPIRDVGITLFLGPALSVGSLTDYPSQYVPGPFPASTDFVNFYKPPGAVFNVCFEYGPFLSAGLSLTTAIEIWGPFSGSDAVYWSVQMVFEVD